MYTTAELQQHFGNEQVLIILLTRLYFKKTTAEEVEQFIQDHSIDNKTFLRIASVHNIRAFLYYVITENRLSFDMDVSEKLKAFHLLNQLRSLEQTSICYNVIRKLEENNIAAIPFKGTILAHAYYTNSGIRESTDIDIFLSSKDVSHTEDILRSSGYLEKIAVPKAYLKYYKKYFKEIVYTAPARTNEGYSVEIHWKLLNYYFGEYPSYDFFKNNKELINIGGNKIFKLQPTYDLLAVASNHFVKDMAIKFKYLIDIAAILDTSKIDTTIVEQVAGEFKCRKKMDIGFQLTEKLIGVKLVDYNHRFLLQTKHTRKILSPDVTVNTLVNDLDFLKASLRTNDSFLQNINFLKRCSFYFFLPTDNDLKAFTSTNISVYLLALIRPFRLGYKFLTTVFAGK